MAAQDFDLYTDRARRVLAQAEIEARLLGHRYVGTEHLLLALMDDTKSIASGVLESLGVEYDQVHRAVEFIIGRGDSK